MRSLRWAIAARTSGCRDEVAQVAHALLDNARVHAAPSAVDVRARSREGMATLYVEDRGPEITRCTERLMFERGRRRRAEVRFRSVYRPTTDGRPGWIVDGRSTAQPAVAR